MIDIKRERVELDRKIEILTQKANFSKERDKENLTNRKIKQLTYSKE